MHAYKVKWYDIIAVQYTKVLNAPVTFEQVERNFADLKRDSCYTH